MKEDRVLVISSGSYSDYRVHAVVRGTPSQAKALAKRASGEWNNYEIGELPVVDHDIKQVSILFVQENIWDNQTTTDHSERIEIEWPFDAPYGTPECAKRFVRAPIHRGRGGRLEVHGTDHERVRKVFSDWREMLLADDALRHREFNK